MSAASRVVVAKVARELDRRKVEVTCLQETKWRGRNIGEDYKLFWSGGKEAVNGVGIAVASTLVSKVTEVKRASDRLMFISLIIGQTIFTVVSAYAPQTGRTEGEKDDFYFKLDALLMGKDALVLGGDLNGQVGKRTAGFDTVHGGFGFGEQNEDGVRVLDLAMAHNLRVVNTWFKKPQEQLVTFTSGLNRTQIDYVLASTKHARARNASQYQLSTNFWYWTLELTQSRPSLRRWRLSYVHTN